MNRRRDLTSNPLRLSIRAILALLAIATLPLVRDVANATAQGPVSTPVSIDTLVLLIGGGVRGHIDTLGLRGAGGPSDQKILRIVRPKGYRSTYAFVADSGFHNLSVMVGDGLVPNKGEVVVGEAQILIVSADRVVLLRPENRKLFQLLRAQLTATDHLMAYKRLGCEMDRLIRIHEPSRADSLIDEAEFLAIDPIRDEAALRRIDRALAGHVFTAGCDTTQSKN